MSEVVTGLVKLTFGFLANKIRSGIAERLKDGDATDEECRRLIVRKLDDIKSKLDGLARKDLLSSFCFLQEGLTALYLSLFQSDSNESATESTLVKAVSSLWSFRDTGFDSPINEAVALINAITSLEIRSNDHYKSAIKSFELAREKATEAFCNEALSIEDRIQASQIRMMARILEKLEHPEASASDCLQYLQQLQDIGAIQEIFSVLIDGGIKSRFNKTKRLNNAASVQVMNQVLFEFVKKFTKPSLSARISAWPTILLGEKTYHPVLGEDRIIEKLKGSGMQVMSLCSDFTFDNKIYSGYYSVVNSKGNIVGLSKDASAFKIFKPTGESRTLCEAPREERVSERYVAAMDIDAEDNLYVITRFREGNGQSWSFKLFIFDKNGNEKLEAALPFQQSSRQAVCMAINKDGKIAILNCEGKILYICNVRVKLNSFKVDKRLSLNELSIRGRLPNVSVTFSDFNGTKIIATNYNTVYIYTENGRLRRKNEIPEEHGFIDSVAINHVTNRTLVKTHHSQGSSLLYFSDTGELIDSLCLGSRAWIRHAVVTSHRNGTVAIVGKTGAALVQL
ncbi:Hypothetical predicted protein [Paramuricea clavata]|uniref:Uncharacterized protein n=1 Tax=Paramuricea clavata TaxID=317549 RepID=A0A7D9L0B9_PARCT|nr:Hypothetical predicted protein [Paramuricea clavata]